METAAQRHHRQRSFATGVGFFALMAFGGCQGGPQEIPVTLAEFSFDPKPLTVPAGQKIVMLVQNKGTVEHNFTVAQLKIASEPIAPGKTTKLEFAVPNGTYKLICTIPGHEEAGMVGEIRATRR